MHFSEQKFRTIYDINKHACNKTFVDEVLESFNSHFQEIKHIPNTVDIPNKTI